MTFENKKRIRKKSGFNIGVLRRNGEIETLLELPLIQFQVRTYLH